MELIYLHSHLIGVFILWLAIDNDLLNASQITNLQRSILNKQDRQPNIFRATISSN